MESTSKEAAKQWSGAPIGSLQIGTSGPAKERASDERPRDSARQIDGDGARASVPAISAPQSYEALESDFRGHHQSSAAGGRGPYEHYRLVYRYGHDLGADPRYRDADWAAVEQQARPRWEERNPDTWELFKETIRYAWDTTRSPHFRM